MPKAIRSKRGPSHAAAKKAVDQWNKRHAGRQDGVGVRYRELIGEDPFHDARTRSAAFVADSGHAVIFIRGKRGYVHLSHVTPWTDLSASEPPPPRHCRVCHCTENDACDDEFAGGCSWVAADLCSSCVAGGSFA